jgi:hypothetical protein
MTDHVDWDDFVRVLALQLQIPFDVSILSGGLVGASPG